MFAAFPIVFQRGRGWGEGIGGLAFMGVAVGMVIAILIGGPLNKLYMKDGRKHGSVAPPEARLHGAMLGAIAIPIGLFWFAWTNSPSVHWISPIAAGAPFGFGLVLIFLAVVSYLIDAYTVFAASVLAANTILRSLFGAAFPLFTRYMYQNLGIHWASSIPAFLSLACVPFPFILYKYGAAIRARCIYASQAEKIMNEMRAQAATSTVEAKDDARRRSSTATSESGELSRMPTNATGSYSVYNQDPLARIPSRASAAERAGYDVNPYDIDRVHTRDNVAGLELKRTRTRGDTK